MHTRLSHPLRVCELLCVCVFASSPQAADARLELTGCVLLHSGDLWMGPGRPGPRPHNPPYTTPNLNPDLELALGEREGP
jgi:hypothetical protein